MASNGIEQRKVDDLAGAAVVLDLAQRDQRRGRAEEAGDAVGQVHRRQHRLAVLEAVDGGKARHALDQRAEAGAPVVGAVLAPARDAHDDQTRISRQQDVGTHPHAFERARAEALDEEVGAGGKLEQRARVRAACADRGTGSSCCGRRPSSASTRPRSARRAACRLRGGSTLITSAPKSPRTCVSTLPANRRDMSRTRIPCSGPDAAGV